MPGISLQVVNLEKVRGQLKRLGPLAQEEFQSALFDEAKQVLLAAELSVPQPSMGPSPGGYLPTGRLKGTAFLKRLLSGQHKADAEVVYSAPYAIYVHERPRGRGYKWLEKAAIKALKGSTGRIRRRLRDALNRK